jgi:hypothetical protein
MLGSAGDTTSGTANVASRAATAAKADVKPPHDNLLGLGELARFPHLLGQLGQSFLQCLWRVSLAVRLKIGCRVVAHGHVA